VTYEKFSILGDKNIYSKYAMQMAYKKQQIKGFIQQEHRSGEEKTPRFILILG
jgi:hypothetical protein